MTPVEYEWRLSDLRVVVTAVNDGGARGVVVSETVEVPWPVRADAPTWLDCGRQGNGQIIPPEREGPVF